MKPLKVETDALAAVLMTPLEEFVSDREQAEHKDPEGLAQKRMFTKAIEAVDEARGARTMWTIVLRFGTVASSVTYQAFGPYETKAKAEKTAESILKTVEATAYALVPLRNEHGWDQMVEAADADPAEKSMWAEVRKDAEAKRRGWKGKARERDNYLKV